MISSHLDETELRLFLTGILSAKESERVELHLRGCVDCRAALEQQQREAGPPTPKSSKPLDETREIPSSDRIQAGEFDMDRTEPHKVISQPAAYVFLSPAAAADLSRDAPCVDARVGLVIAGDDDLDPGAQHPALGAVGGQAVELGQRVGRHRRAQPLDDIAVVVIVRRLDQLDEEAFPNGGRTGGHGAPQKAADGRRNVAGAWLGARLRTLSVSRRGACNHRDDARPRRAVSVRRRPCAGDGAEGG